MSSAADQGPASGASTATAMPSHPTAHPPTAPGGLAVTISDDDAVVLVIDGAEVARIQSASRARIVLRITAPSTVKIRREGRP